MSVLVPGSIFAEDLRRCQANDPSFHCLDWSDVPTPTNRWPTLL
eukprot:COSAG02_NODE_62002_length_267_cov_0.613095_2_plen_43_part_01